MALDARHGQGTPAFGEASDHLGPRPQGGAAALPGRPGSGSMHLADLVIPGEPAVVGTDHVAPLGLGNQRLVPLPVVGADATGTLLVEPADDLVTAQAH